MNGSIVKAAWLAVLCAGLVGQAPAQDFYQEGPVTINLSKTTMLPEVETCKGNTTTWTWKTQVTRITNNEIIEWVGEAMGETFSPGAKLMASDDEFGFCLFVRDPVLGDVYIDEYLTCYMWGQVDAGSSKRTDNPDTGAYSGSESAKGAAEFAIECTYDVPVLAGLLLTGYGTYSYSTSWKGDDESETESGSASGKGTITAGDDEEPCVITGTISFSLKTVAGG